MRIWLWLACTPAPEELLARGLAASSPTEAASDLGAACDAGLVAACDAAGALAVDDPARATWNERACDGGIVAACTRRSEAPGDPWAGKACALGDGAACAGAGRLADACLAGHAPSCLLAGDEARRKGDLEAAATLYDVRCAHDPNDTACVLAERVRHASPKVELAWPTGAPEAISAELWAACAVDDPWGCLRLAEHVSNGGPLPEQARGDATWLRGQACDLQLVYACAPHQW